ncbi:hypothetical protein SEA_BLINO_34 [Gordonia phage Blino]|uniref:Uncharacterized protein n=1 Tax=Gordonia phage Blino TaxID=2793696 RepID=A0A7T0M247_9CAUD|nr:hypothetical protein BIZ75_gp34 [Gordonia phage CarolAnn]YP_010114123.1 hypothetical protein KNV70_gp34 [Gordonia phage Blino]AOE44051.1 hypothetical protein SEA_CAROLANN_34 [Gordonia phage CarolAnn]QPL13982.1 hypothetical protein SEA_BLINO_34 [Gordonia phage Blino]
MSDYNSRSFHEKIDRAIQYLTERIGTPDTGMAPAGGPGSAEYMPLTDREFRQAEADLQELFAIRAATEPPHSPLPGKALRQRLWDVEDRYGLHPPHIARP